MRIENVQAGIFFGECPTCRARHGMYFLPMQNRPDRVEAWGVCNEHRVKWMISDLPIKIAEDTTEASGMDALEVGKEVLGEYDTVVPANLTPNLREVLDKRERERH